MWWYFTLAYISMDIIPGLRALWNWQTIMTIPKISQTIVSTLHPPSSGTWVGGCSIVGSLLHNFPEFFLKPLTLSPQKVRILTSPNWERQLEDRNPLQGKWSKITQLKRNGLRPKSVIGYSAQTLFYLPWTISVSEAIIYRRYCKVCSSSTKRVNAQ